VSRCCRPGAMSATARARALRLWRPSLAGVVPASGGIQVRFDRATGAGELVKFGQPVWYRFSFKGRR